GRRGKAEAAGHGRGDVREDVAEHVLGDDDVDRLRARDDLHREAVDERVPAADVPVLERDDVDDAAPELRGVEHVGLVDRDERLAATARELEAAAHDALDLRRVVLAGVEYGPVLARSARAEVQPADQLTDDDEVDFALLRRAQVRVDVERLAQPEQPLLGPDGAAVPS